MPPAEALPGGRLPPSFAPLGRSQGWAAAGRSYVPARTRGSLDPPTRRPAASILAASPNRPARLAPAGVTDQPGRAGAGRTSDPGPAGRSARLPGSRSPCAHLPRATCAPRAAAHASPAARPGGRRDVSAPSPRSPPGVSRPRIPAPRGARGCPWNSLPPWARGPQRPSRRGGGDQERPTQPAAPPIMCPRGSATKCTFRPKWGRGWRVEGWSMSVSPPPQAGRKQEGPPGYFCSLARVRPKKWGVLGAL